MATQPDEIADLPERFGTWFRAERARVFGTQMQAAIGLRQSITTIANWEHGRMLPDFRNWVRICRAFGLPLPLGEPEPPDNPPMIGSATGRKLSHEIRPLPIAA